MKNGLLVAQATRLFRPATRRTERERRFEPMWTVIWRLCARQFRSAGRRPGRSGRPRHPFSKPQAATPRKTSQSSTSLEGSQNSASGERSPDRSGLHRSAPPPTGTCFRPGCRHLFTVVAARERSAAFTPLQHDLFPVTLRNPQRRGNATARRPEGRAPLRRS